MTIKFQEIIFSKIIKPNINNDKNDLNYFFQYNEDDIAFMVHCPLCEKIYKYSSININSNPKEFINGIELNTAHFKEEWEENCPDKNYHFYYSEEYLRAMKNNKDIYWEWAD